MATVLDEVRDTEAPLHQPVGNAPSSNTFIAFGFVSGTGVFELNSANIGISVL
jgi:hypothetical protein